MSLDRRAADRPTYLLLARHADVHNPDKVLYGRLPRFRLSDHGIGEAQRLARFLSEVRLAAIYSSPQLRARQTARYVAAHHPEVKPRVSHLVAEVLTAYQGLREHEIGNVNFFVTPKSPDDETLDGIFARLSRFVRRTVKQYQGQVVLAVSHGDPIKIASLGLAGADLQASTFRRYDIPNKASVTCLRFDDPEADPVLAYFDTARQGEDDWLSLADL